MLNGDDDTKRTLAKASVLLVLVLSIVTVNAANVVQQELRDNEQRTASFEDAAFDQRLSVGLQQELAQNISKATPAEMNATRLASAAVTESYTRSVVNSNIREVYAFLNAERQTADISWNLNGAQRRLARQIDDPEVQQDVNATVPSVVVIQEDISSGPFGVAQKLVSLLPLAVGSCVAGTLLALGAEGYRTRSVRHVARRMGAALSVGGVVSIILGGFALVTVQFVSISFAGNVAIDPQIVSDGLSRVATNAAVRLLWQSVLLVGLGVVLVFAGRAETHRSSFGTTRRASAKEDTSHPAPEGDES